MNQQELEAFLGTLKVHNKDLDVCFNDAVAVGHLMRLFAAQQDRLIKDIESKLPKKPKKGNSDLEKEFYYGFSEALDQVRVILEGLRGGFEEVSDE